MRTREPERDTIWLKRTAMRVMDELPPELADARYVLGEVHKLLDYVEGRRLPDDADECEDGDSEGGNVVEFPRRA